jgi:hypothetical protein
MASLITRKEGSRMGEMVFNIFVFVIFTVLWIVFGVALVFSRGSLDNVWHSFRAMPLVVQLLGWLLFLPNYLRVVDLGDGLAHSRAPGAGGGVSMVEHHRFLPTTVRPIKCGDNTYEHTDCRSPDETYDDARATAC